jgi:hypothetical protein
MYVPPPRQPRFAKRTSKQAGSADENTAHHSPRSQIWIQTGDYCWVQKKWMVYGESLRIILDKVDVRPANRL